MDRNHYVDTDTTDSDLDGPPPRYKSGPLATGAELDKRLDPEYRKEHGLAPLRPLPPVTDH